MTIPIPVQAGRRKFHLPKMAPSAFSIVLLLLQPVLFFRRVLINPRAHIPYDIEGFHLPLIAYVARCVRNGIAPWWDPNVLCGMPIHADLQAQVFYPFTWLPILASSLHHGRTLFYWVEVLIPLHMALAGLFAFLLLRKMGLCTPAALLGASVYQLGGYFASQAQHLCAICTGAWLPLAVLAAFELRRGFRLRWVAVLASAVALSILSGFAATAVVVAVAVWLIVATLLVMREATWRIIPPVVAGFLTGAAIAAVELIPLWGLTQASIASLRWKWYLLGGGLPVRCLVSLVRPNYYHIFNSPACYGLPDNFTFMYIYCGLAPLVLIVLAPFTRRARPIAFLILTVLGAFWMLGEHTPVYRSIFTRLPRLLRGALYSEYALLAFCFFAAITAALVLDRFRNRLPLAVLWGVALLTSYDLIHTGANRPMNTLPGSYKASQWTLDSEPITGGAQSSSAPLAPFLRALANQTNPPSRVDYTDSEFLEGIYAPGMLQIPTSNGDNPFMLKRMLHLRGLFATARPWERLWLVNRYDSPLLNMLNVSQLAGLKPIPPDEVTRAGLIPLPTVQGIHIYANPRALPRFFLTPRIRKSRDEEETLRLLSGADFKPSEEAIVEGISDDRDGLAIGEVMLVRYSENRIELGVSIDRPGFLVTSEAMYPGWEATVNGTPQPLLMTNSAFRGLALHSGASRVVMEYRPRWLPISLAITLLALLATATAGLWPGKDRHPMSPERYRSQTAGAACR